MHRSLALTALAVILTLVPVLDAFAEEATDAGFRFGLYGGVLATDPDEMTSSGPTVGGRIGGQFDRVFAVEFNLGYAESYTRDVGRFTRVFTPRLDFLFHIPTDTVFTPFFVVGPGVIGKKVNRAPDVQEVSPNDQGYGLYNNPDTDFLLNAGGGLLIQFGELPLFFRTDLRYLANIGTEPHGGRGVDYFNDLEFTAGLMLRAGPTSSKDRDGDGYLDEDDSCPDRPEDFDNFEDADGCPDPDNDGDGIEDVDDDCPDDREDFDDFDDQDGCPDPDNDLDGTVDGRDECPVIPGPAESFGCPDRDTDRVPDYRDDCPDEPADVRADPLRSDGCPSKVVVTKEEVVILDKVFFDTDKETIKPVSFDILGQVADVLQKYKDIRRVEVSGHTDSDGTDEYNEDLSQRRAQAVVDYLVGQGVAGSRLEAKGYGESVPIDDNNTEDGRAQNRRVEFIILEQ